MVFGEAEKESYMVFTKDNKYKVNFRLSKQHYTHNIIRDNIYVLPDEQNEFTISCQNPENLAKGGDTQQGGMQRWREPSDPGVSKPVKVVLVSEDAIEADAFYFQFRTMRNQSVLRIYFEHEIVDSVASQQGPVVALFCENFTGTLQEIANTDKNRLKVRHIIKQVAEGLAYIHDTSMTWNEKSCFTKRHWGCVDPNFIMLQEEPLKPNAVHRKYTVKLLCIGGKDVRNQLFGREICSTAHAADEEEGQLTEEEIQLHMLLDVFYLGVLTWWLLRKHDSTTFADFVSQPFSKDVSFRQNDLVRSFHMDDFGYVDGDPQLAAQFIRRCTVALSSYITFQKPLFSHYEGIEGMTARQTQQHPYLWSDHKVADWFMDAQDFLNLDRNIFSQIYGSAELDRRAYNKHFDSLLRLRCPRMWGRMRAGKLFLSQNVSQHLRDYINPSSALFYLRGYMHHAKESEANYRHQLKICLRECFYPMNLYLPLLRYCVNQETVPLMDEEDSYNSRLTVPPNADVEFFLYNEYDAGEPLGDDLQDYGVAQRGIIEPDYGNDDNDDDDEEEEEEIEEGPQPCDFGVYDHASLLPPTMSGYEFSLWTPMDHYGTDQFTPQELPIDQGGADPFATGAPKFNCDATAFTPRATPQTPTNFGTDRGLHVDAAPFQPQNLHNSETTVSSLSSLSI